MDITTLLFTLAYILMVDGKPSNFYPEYNENEMVSNDKVYSRISDLETLLETLIETLDVKIPDEESVAANPISNADLDDTALSHKHKSMLIGSTTANPTDSVDNEGVSNEKGSSRISESMSNDFDVDGELDELDTLIETVMDELFTVEESVAANPISNADLDDTVLSHKHKSMLIGSTTANPTDSVDVVSTILPTSDANVNSIELSEKHKSMLRSTTSNPTSNSDIDSTTAEPVTDDNISGIELSEKHKSMLLANIEAKLTTNSIVTTANPESNDVDGIELSEKHKSMLGRTTADPPFNSVEVTDADSAIANDIALSEPIADDITLAEPIFDVDVDGIDIALAESILDADVDESDVVTDSAIPESVSITTELLFDSDLDGNELSEKQKSMLVSTTTLTLNSDVDTTIVKPTSDSDSDGIELSEKHKSMLIASATANPALNSEDGIDGTFVQSISETAEPIPESELDGIGLSEKHKSMLITSTTTNPIPNSDDIDTTVELISESVLDNIELSEKHKSMLISTTTNPTLISDVDPILEADEDGIQLSEKHKSMLIGSATSKSVDSTTVEPILDTALSISDSDLEGIELSAKHKSMLIGSTTTKPTTNADSIVSTEGPASINLDGIELSARETQSDDLEVLNNNFDADIEAVAEVYPQELENALPVVPLIEETADNTNLDVESNSELINPDHDAVLNNVDEETYSEEVVEVHSKRLENVFPIFPVIGETPDDIYFDVLDLESVSAKPNIPVDNLETEIEPTVEKQVPIDEGDNVLHNINLESNKLDESNILDESLESEASFRFEDIPENILVKDEFENSGENSLYVPEREEIEFHDNSPDQFMEFVQPPNDQPLNGPVLPAAGGPVLPGAGGPLVPSTDGSEIYPVVPGIPADDGSVIPPPVVPGRRPTNPMVNIPAVTTPPTSVQGNGVCEGKFVRGTELGRCILPFEYAGESHCDCLPRMFLAIDLPWTWCPTTITNGVIESWDHCTYTYTELGSKCIFPFVDDGVEYNDCAPGTVKPQHYCATSLKDDGITVDTWEVCADADSPNPSGHAHTHTHYRGKLIGGGGQHDH